MEPVPVHRHWASINVAMSAEGVVAIAAVEVMERSLEERLRRGAEILFDMERRGDMGHTYEEWLRRWEQMLRQLESTA